jgi:LysM repeat protein
MRRVFVASVFSLLVVTSWVGLTGCEPNESLPFASEVDEPHYRRGAQLLRGGRTQEALEAFLKVIDKRGGDAPESHLESGILYLQHLKDPVAAIYHFRKYLEMRPSSPQAARTRELIETATKEFARTLPAQPFEGQVKVLDLMEQVERLQKENTQLKEQISQALTAAGFKRPAGNVGSATQETDSAAPTEPEAEPVVAVPAETPAPPPPVRPTPLPAIQKPVTTVASAGTTSTPGGRVYTVKRGDSLYSISRQYFGNGSRIDDIVAANRPLLSSRTSPLKPGMQLRIPEQTPPRQP